MDLTSKYQDCLDYIDSYWDKITKTQTKDDLKKGPIKLPKPFLVPNTTRFSLMFYWDSYFMSLGVLGTKRQVLALDLVENMAYLFDRFGIIPNVSSFLFLGSSQPPVFSSLIMEIYNTTQDKEWLEKYIKVAEEEHRSVWTSIGQDIGLGRGSFHHAVEGYNLSRYGDRDAGYSLNSERESGWDFTKRFYNRCAQFLPIDLNGGFLYKSELNFAESAKILGDNLSQEKWLKQAEERKEEINNLMWNKEKGFFFDYDFVHKVQSNFYSLAGFLPLWSGLATKEQAAQMVKHLDKFETESGLTITDPDSIKPIAISDAPEISQEDLWTLNEVLTPKQWDYPSIWRPIEYLVVIGLLEYGYTKEAVRIMEKALAAEAKIFRQYGEFYEKMNGLTGDKSSNFHYPNQGGFGWTNAIFSRYVQLLKDPA